MSFRLCNGDSKNSDFCLNKKVNMGVIGAILLILIGWKVIKNRTAKK